MSARIGLCCIGVLMALPVSARPPAASPESVPSATTADRALPPVPQVEPGLMISAALQVLRLIDADPSGAV